MQGLIYENDRQVKERHAYWGLDPENPRAEILIEKIAEVAPQKKPGTKAGKKEKQPQGGETPQSNDNTGSPDELAR
jgi:hypothetical protein